MSSGWRLRSALWVANLPSGHSGAGAAVPSIQRTHCY